MPYNCCAVTMRFLRADKKSTPSSLLWPFMHFCKAGKSKVAILKAILAFLL